MIRNIKNCRQKFRDGTKKVKLGLQYENMLDVDLPKFWHDIGPTTSKVMKQLEVYWHESDADRNKRSLSYEL